MQQTVLFREEGSTSSRGDCGGNSLVAEFDKAQFAGDRRAPRTDGAQHQAGGWMRKIARAFMSMENEEVPLRSAIDRRMHELSKGWTKRMHFARGGRISCCTGKVWITFDRGGEDIVLTARECKDFDPGARVLVEALAKSQVLLEAL
jgi:hypothetical protein